MSERDLAALTSVVVCARNRAGLIGETLRSIVRNRPREIIVIDDMSTDDTAAVARTFTERVIPSGGHGLAAARQLGAESALSAYVVYVDSDVVLENGCIAGLIEALEADPTLGAAVATLLETDQSTYWGGAAQATRRLMRTQETAYRRTFPCATVAVRRQIILDVRFDPFFSGAGEDIDFSRRLVDAGWRILRCPVVARHRRRDGWWEMFRHQIWYGRGAARLALRARNRRSSEKDSKGEPAKDFALRRLIKDGGLTLIPYLVVSGIAYKIGIFVETQALSKKTIPPVPGPAQPSTKGLDSAA